MGVFEPLTKPTSEPLKKKLLIEVTYRFVLSRTAGTFTFWTIVLYNACSMECTLEPGTRAIFN